MNLHPIIVHFPVVCLTLYSFIEIISIFHAGFRAKFQFTKLVLLIIGIAGGFAGLMSGEVAQQILEEKSKTVLIHEVYANLTVKVYLIILLGYIIHGIGTKWGLSNPIIARIVLFFGRLYKYGIIALLALLGFVLLSIVGALGGAISHGPAADPITQFVFDLLVQ